MLAPSDPPTELSRQGDRLPADPARHLEALIGAASGAVAAGDLVALERLADRARRLAPDDPALALLCATLLAKLDRPAEVLRVLARRERSYVIPEWGLLTAEAHVALGQIDAALELVHSLLRRFALDSLGRLPALATALARLEDVDFVGWLGLTAGGSGTGVLAPGTTIRALDADDRLVAVAQADRTGRFDLPLSWPLLAGGLSVESPAGPVIGAGVLGLPSFAPAGEAHVAGDEIVGWARLGWSPATALPVRLVDRSGNEANLVVPASRDDHMLERPAFTARLDALGLSGEISVSAILPDGSAAGLAGSPLCRDVFASGRSALPVAEPPNRRPTASVPAARVTVAVPVYTGREDTMACLRSVLQTIDPALADILVIDDASPDRGLIADIEELVREGRLTLLRNGCNLGFPASANRAFAWNDTNDVVLLNADAEVYGDWLERLRQAAYSSEAIGTVTPLSNCASIVSYPAGREAACSAALAADLDMVTAEANCRTTVDLPTGIGFCLYLRRDCISEIGPLDAETFGRGYGEEDDFCLRARRAGWRSVAAADVFVRHIGAASFGPMRSLRIAHATRLIEQLHPGYGALITSFFASDPLRPARRAIDIARLSRFRRRSVLFVTVALPGGIDRHLDTRAAALAAEGVRAIWLRPNAEKAAGGLCRLRVAGAGLEDLVFRLPDEIEGLAALLAAVGVDHVELHHFHGLSPSVLELPKRLGATYDVFVHDYVWLCPRIVLLDEAGQYCGEPDLVGCEACIRTHGAILDEAIGVAELRRRSRRLMEEARRVVGPSHDAAARIARHFPGIAASVEAWETLPQRPLRPMPPAGTDGRLRVALIGAFGNHKGLLVLQGCARDAERRDLPLEFVLIGHSIDDAGLFATGRVFVTGPFEEDEVEGLIARERCAVALFPSVWPETWCYALSHALRAGLPVAAFAIGAMTERLRDVPLTRLMPLGLLPAAINDTLIELASEAAGRHNAAATAAGAGARDGRPILFGRVEDVSNTTNVPTTVAAPGVSASAQVLTLAEGLYAFGVRTSGTGDSPDPDLALPALHVALAPAIARGGELTILASPAMTSPWLTRAGDAIVAQVSGGPCHVVLTSLSPRNGQPLDVEVRRLDQRPAAAAPEPSRIVAGSNQPAPESAMADQTLIRLQVLTHIQNRGDVPFVGGVWAGFIGQSVWMEAFALAALEKLGPNAIEYKARTAGGFETPWLSGGVWCGTRGMGVPLVEFAIRLTPEFSATHACEYSGAFFSGNIIGPLRDGAPCRSRVPNDPLEAIQVRIYEREAAAQRGRL